MYVLCTYILFCGAYTGLYIVGAPSPLLLAPATRGCGVLVYVQCDDPPLFWTRKASLPRLARSERDDASPLYPLLVETAARHSLHQPAEHPAGFVFLHCFLKPHIYACRIPREGRSRPYCQVPRTAQCGGNSHQSESFPASARGNPEAERTLLHNAKPREREVGFGPEPGIQTCDLPTAGWSPLQCSSDARTRRRSVADERRGGANSHYHP
jgi:hypothetical protein